MKRDHLIGYILAALAEIEAPVVFLGGTALSWTHLPNGRLSEDIDLMTNDRRSTAEMIEHELPRRLHREFPGASWDPGLVTRRSVESARLWASDGLVVMIQLIDAGRQGWNGIPLSPRLVRSTYAKSLAWG